MTNLRYCDTTHQSHIVKEQER